MHILCDRVCPLLVEGWSQWWFSLGSPASSNTKTDRCIWPLRVKIKKYVEHHHVLSCYTSGKQSLGGYRNHLVRPSVHESCKHNSSEPARWNCIKLDTVVVHHLKMCMKEYNSGPHCRRRDNQA